MKVRRDISSIPLRTAEATWQTIVDLITGADSVDAMQLQAATGVMASLITDDHYAQHPLTLVGLSHRLVLYCRYGQEALEAGEAVDDLTWNPTAGDWTLFVPCDLENLVWVRKALKGRAPRFVVHELGEESPEEMSELRARSTEKVDLVIDWEKVK